MAERSCTIGLDVGGTKIAGLALDAAGGIAVAGRAIPTDAERGGENVLRRAARLAEDLASSARAARFEVRALGVGVPEIVSREGAISSDGVIPWLGLPVAERFSRIAPAVLDSDVRAAARAEAELGCARGLRSFAYVNVGTGISSTLVLDGLPYPGARGGALVLASGTAGGRCPSCDAELSLVLEEIASGPGIVSRHRQLGGLAVDAKDVVDAAGAGVPAAARAIGEAATALGSRIALLVDVVDPEAVVLGGGLGATPGAYWDALVPAIRSHIWWDGTRDLPILQAALGPDAGAIGAALAARGADTLS